MAFYNYTAIKDNKTLVNGRVEAPDMAEARKKVRQMGLIPTSITEDGEIVNVDCIGNRVGALMFGPKKVIVIVGRNKICKNKEEAIKRAREIAAPINMQRIAELSGRKTPCVVDGVCHDCKSENSICSNIVITRLCYPQKRIKVILVNEDLGF